MPDISFTSWASWDAFGIGYVSDGCGSITQRYAIVANLEGSQHTHTHYTRWVLGHDDT